MYKVVAVWTAPAAEDREAFEKHYFDVHVPKAARVPHLQDLILVRNEHSTAGDWYGSAEMTYVDEEAFKESLASPEWAEMAADTQYMERTFNVSLKVLLGKENRWPVG